MSTKQGYIVDMSTNEILDAFSLLRRELAHLRAVELKSYDFGPMQMLILLRLLKSAATMGELAEHALVDKAAITRSVASLISSGLVKKTTDEKDLRITIIELTTRGKNKAAEAMSVREILGKKLNNILTNEERKELARLLTKAGTGLSQKRN